MWKVLNMREEYKFLVACQPAHRPTVLSWCQIEVRGWAALLLHGVIKLMRRTCYPLYSNVCVFFFLHTLFPCCQNCLPINRGWAVIVSVLTRNQAELPHKSHFINSFTLLSLNICSIIIHIKVLSDLLCLLLVLFHGREYYQNHVGTSLIFFRIDHLLSIFRWMAYEICMTREKQKTIRGTWNT